MPRRRRGCRITDPCARRVAARMCFAAAAEELGGLYGSTCLERALCFSPSARAERRSASNPTSKTDRAKRAWPTGGCKKWLHGHVVNDQTLALIAETLPKVAQRMRQARESDVVKALMVSPADYRFVGSRICKFSPELLGNYLGCLALGHRNPIFASRLCTDLHHRALGEAGLEVLAVAIGLDRQLLSPRAHVTAKGLDDVFTVALTKAADAHREIAFARDALVEAWLQREPMRRVQAPPRVVPFPSRKYSWPADANSESSRPIGASGARHSTL